MRKMQYLYSFDDVLLLPKFADFMPSEANTQIQLTHNIKLKTPFLSAAMDTVTEARMAIKMAVLGGIGVIHKNMSINNQCLEITKVKNFQCSGDDGATVDENGRLQVLAAIGTHPMDFMRAEKLVIAGVSALVIDTSHGHSQNVYNTIKKIKHSFPAMPIIAGNIATKESAEDLLKLGVDGLKVGIGPGSICTTRVVSGVGVPQISAIMSVYEACRNKNVSIIADGGIKYSGDVAKAISAGASCVMIGSLLAGTDESPGEIFEENNKKYKKYRGMGSVEAMQSGSAERYFQKEGAANLVPQGVVGSVLYKGKVEDIVRQIHGGLISAMGYTGNKTIEKMRKDSNFCLVTQSGVQEGHVHGLSSFKETQNYKTK